MTGSISEEANARLEALRRGREIAREGMRALGLDEDKPLFPEDFNYKKFIEECTAERYAEKAARSARIEAEEEERARHSRMA